MSPLFILLVLVPGAVVGWLIKPTDRIKRILTICQIVILLALMLMMGIKIGMIDDLLNKLASIGWKALVTSVGACLGSVSVVWCAEKLFLRRKKEGTRS